MNEADSRYSWTVDFAAHREEARQKRRPLLDQATAIRADVIDLKEKLRRLRKDSARESDINAVEASIREREKAARDLEADAAGIDAQVFDLKAVNPKTVAKLDTRTPAEIIESIEHYGLVATQALARLNTLLATKDPAAETRATPEAAR